MQNDIKNDDALQSLGDRLDDAKARHTEAEVPDRRNTAIGLKYASEFSAAIIVGAALGYGADKLLGTAPWGLLVGLILGFAAGVMNIIRVGREALASTDLG